MRIKIHYQRKVKRSEEYTEKTCRKFTQQSQLKLITGESKNELVWRVLSTLSASLLILI